MTKFLELLDDWLTEWLTDWQSEWMSEWMTGEISYFFAAHHGQPSVIQKFANWTFFRTYAFHDSCVTIRSPITPVSNQASNTSLQLLRSPHMTPQSGHCITDMWLRFVARPRCQVSLCGSQSKMPCERCSTEWKICSISHMPMTEMSWCAFTIPNFVTLDLICA